MPTDNLAANLAAINQNSRYDFYLSVKQLFETMEIEYWGKTGLPKPPTLTNSAGGRQHGTLPGPPGKSTGRVERLEKGVKAGTSGWESLTTGAKVVGALRTGDAGDKKKHSLAKVTAQECVKMIIAGVKQVNKTAGSIAQIASDISSMESLEKNRLEDYWVKPLETALEHLFEEMFGSVPHSVNVAAANHKGVLALKQHVMDFGTAVVNRHRVAQNDIDSIITGGPDVVANTVTRILNQQIAVAAANIAMEGLKASLTIASFGSAHAAVELGSKAMECLAKMGKLIYDVNAYVDFLACAPQLAKMKLDNRQVSNQDEKTLKKCIALSPLCAAVIMGHPYMSYYTFMVVTDIGKPIKPNIYEMTNQQRKTLECFNALKKTARTYCKGVPHGLRSSDGVVQSFLEPLMRGSTTVPIQGLEDRTALQSVMAITHHRRRFVVRINRAIEQWKGIAVADDATVKTAGQGFGDVLFANPFKSQNRTRKRDMLANAFAKAKNQFGHHPEKVFIQYIDDHCVLCENSSQGLDRQFLRYLGALDRALPREDLERWFRATRLYEDFENPAEFNHSRSLGVGLVPLGETSRLCRLLTAVFREEKRNLIFDPRGSLGGWR